MSGTLKARQRKDCPTMKERDALYKQGEIFACIYGKSVEPQNLYLNVKGKKDLHVGGVYILEFEGRKLNAVIKQFEKHPIRVSRQHIALQVVAANEKTTIEIPVELKGKAVGEKEGGVVAQMLSTIELFGTTSSIPEYLQIDISDLHLNSKIALKDIVLPNGVEWVLEDLETTVVVCNSPKASDDEPTEAPKTEVIGEAKNTENESK